MDVYEYILLWALLLIVHFVILIVMFPFVFPMIVIRRYTANSFVRKWLEYSNQMWNDLSILLTWWNWKSPPKIGTRLSNGWELVARMKKRSFAEYQRFHPVKCESIDRNDPFRPQHMSTVYVVEHCKVRCKKHGEHFNIIIWKVSLLDGGRKKITTFNCSSTSHNHGDELECYHNAGIILVAHLNDLAIVDIKYDDVKIYPATGRFPLRHSMTCIRRLENSDGSLGWRVRNMFLSITLVVTEGNPRIRARIRKGVWDFRDRGYGGEEESIDFGQWDHLNLDHIRVHVESKFGVHIQQRQQNGIQEGPTMLYDVSSGQYEYYAILDQFLQSNPSFSRYLDAAKNTPELNFGIDYAPIWINDRECIHGFSDGTIYRLEFQPPSMRYMAAKNMFPSIPGLRDQMTAEQFRQKTGIERMSAHFSR